MKKLFFILLVCIAFATNANAQKDSIKVWGNCGMCKTRIEKAAKTAGATSATWNDETKMLYVKYAVGGNNQKIQKAVAAVGHDTEKFAAPEEVYNKLHGCCKYERKAVSEKSTSQSCCKDMEKCKKESCCTGSTCSKNSNCCSK